jgi:DNA-binding beta-propeller fold protein YncE
MAKTKAGKIEYSVVEGWEQLPRGYAHRDVAGVAVDGEDRVYLMCRGDHPVMIYDSKGNFRRSWGEGDFSYRTHGIYVAPNGTLFCTDDGQHTVRQFSPEGKLLMTLGTKNTPSDTGYNGKDLGTIKRAAGPFNRPTNVAIGPRGDIYISDGYGNARVHVFSPAGQLKRSWGEPGSGPGQFHLPHGIACSADGRVWVCDREADRIQIFSPDGEYLSEWKDTQRPTHLTFDSQGRVYVTELAWHEGDHSYSLGDIKKFRQARMSIFDRNGKVLARWGTPQVTAPGSFAAPHGLALDSRGDLYVSEVTWTFAVSRGRAPEDCHTFQKFSLKTS